MPHIPLPPPENTALNSANMHLSENSSSTTTPVAPFAPSSTPSLITSHNGSTTDPCTLSDSFLSFHPTTHAAKNPLLPTQSVRPRAAKRTLNSAQSYTMNEAKAAKQQKAMLLKQDLVLLLEDYEAKIDALAQKHSTKVEHVKRLATTVSGLKNKRAPGRMQTLLHLKAQEVNSGESNLS